MSTLVKRNLSLFMLIMLMTNVINVLAYRPEGGYVYDNFDILTDSQENEIDEYLYEVDQQTNFEIVIIIEDYPVDSNGDTYPTMFDMAMDYFHNIPLSGKTGIGDAEEDTGVLVIMTLKDYAGDNENYYLLTGYGAEEYITDAEAGRILDNLIEHLDEWEDYQGIKDCAKEVAKEIGYVKPVPVVDTPSGEEPSDIGEPLSMGMMINVIIVLLVVAVLFIPVTNSYEDEQYIWEAKF